MGAGILAKVLFTAFGKPISVKTILLAILGLLIAVGIFFAFRFINGYFQHIKDIEAQNAQLLQDKTTLQEQKKTLIQTNLDNEATRTTQNQINTSNQNIATDERHASQQRSSQYKEISHAIQNTPTQPVQPGHPAVAPVISNTLDQLWGDNAQPASNVTHK
jgi:uncharacterized membrane protein YhiD involved in acid resistance